MMHEAFQATIRLGSVTVATSVPLGKYWPSSPLVFPLEPRCQGACGSQKHTSIAASMRIRFQLRISGPWSQVSERRSA
jgi:hypothetical protein